MKFSLATDIIAVQNVTFMWIKCIDSLHKVKINKCKLINFW